MNYKQIKAIEQTNKKRILKVCPYANEQCGIYFFLRAENGFSYCYVGQAKHLLTRLAQHLSGYQHIDNSIRKRGWYDSTANETGWRLYTKHCNESELNELEKKYILEFSTTGFQMLNKTAGGQDKGKFGIAPNKPPKGYRDGLAQGYKNAQKEVAKYATRLIISYDETKKIDERYYNNFKEFIGEENERNC